MGFMGDEGRGGEGRGADEVGLGFGERGEGLLGGASGGCVSCRSGWGWRRRRGRALRRLRGIAVAGRGGGGPS